ncbi:hypothetical protein RvY_16856-3 [Ramazzottius varieornatus]|uniref:Neurotransmitter-gated ion-channel ligand-binding domain-containing protein n=1 Tax=Ramazzottius varieornatus TaxID=947166 RepID=A0A1D1VZZ7_RAMVA|nr:hypothetical protein RvY_16856-3 [Ramazzottius varieornatus]
MFLSIVSAHLLYCLVTAVWGSEAQDRLITELFLARNYDTLSRPVEQANQTVIVKFGLTLNILVFVSDMDQVMKTNGYLTMQWDDTRLIWNPELYDGLSVLRLPVDKVWQPDVALTNTVDRQFWPNYRSNVVIYNTGMVLWVPPFIFKSGCDTNPLYFPFDIQLCNMVFRSVTYHAKEVDFELADPPKMELKDYSEQPSGSWDVASVPLARLYRMIYRRRGASPDVSVQLDLLVARKSQFYVITFLLPCACIAFLTVFIFYLPTASGEKLCLAISILFSIVIFLLILIDILPPSDIMPLMTKFLVFTFVCNVISVIIETVLVNWYYRSPKTHRMSKWVRRAFLEILPKYLRMRRPAKSVKKPLFVPVSSSISQPTNDTTSLPYKSAMRSPKDSRTAGSVHFAAADADTDGTAFAMDSNGRDGGTTTVGRRRPTMVKSPSGVWAEERDRVVLRDVLALGEYLRAYTGFDQAMANVAYIAQNMEEQDEEGDVSDDWKYIAMVVDRLLLWVFFIGNAIGSLSILLNSPHLYTPLEKP